MDLSKLYKKLPSKIQESDELLILLIKISKTITSVTPEKIQAIYREKTEAFNACLPVGAMPGSYELLQKVVRDGLT